MEMASLCSDAVTLAWVGRYTWEALLVDIALVAEKSILWLLLALGSLPCDVFPEVCQISVRFPLPMVRGKHPDAPYDDAGKTEDDAHHKKCDYDDQDNGGDDDMFGEEGSDDGEGDLEDDAGSGGGSGGDDDEYEDDDEDCYMEEGNDEEEEEDQEEGSMAANSDNTTASEEDMDDYPLLRHACEVYTSNSFRMFEHEHKKSRTLNVDVIKEDYDERGLVFDYELKKIGNYSGHHTVNALPMDGIVNCSCKYFESSGILCSHAQTVLRCLRIDEIPDHYILKSRAKNERSVPLEEPCCLNENGKQHQLSSPDCIHHKQLTAASSGNSNGLEDGGDSYADYVDAPLLRHARDFYLSNIFDMFQEEYKKSECIVADVVYETCDHRGVVVDYEIRKPGHYLRHHKLHAEPTDGTVNCSCKKFENDGILCSHALAVLDSLCIVRIPAQYILERFEKDATVNNEEDIHGPMYSELVGFIRYKIVQTKIGELMNMAAKCDWAQNLIEQGFNELTAELKNTSKNQAPTDTNGASLIECKKGESRSATQEEGITDQEGFHDGQPLKNRIEKELNIEKGQSLSISRVSLDSCSPPGCHATQPFEEFPSSPHCNVEPFDHKKD